MEILLSEISLVFNMLTDLGLTYDEKRDHWVSKSDGYLKFYENVFYICDNKETLIFQSEKFKNISDLLFALEDYFNKNCSVKDYIISLLKAKNIEYRLTLESNPVTISISSDIPCYIKIFNEKDDNNLHFISFEVKSYEGIYFYKHVIVNKGFIINNDIVLTIEKELEKMLEFKDKKEKENNIDYGLIKDIIQNRLKELNVLLDEKDAGTDNKVLRRKFVIKLISGYQLYDNTIYFHQNGKRCSITFCVLDKKFNYLYKVELISDNLDQDYIQKILTEIDKYIDFINKELPVLKEIEQLVDQIKEISIKSNIDPLIVINKWLTEN